LGFACNLLQAPEEGWGPQHLLVRDTTGALLGCCPLYLKGHSYGEYVFDNSWANYSTMMGKRYYPKLQCCVPFTPVTGPRLLVTPGPDAALVRRVLAQSLVAVAGAAGAMYGSSRRCKGPSHAVVAVQSGSRGCAGMGGVSGCWAGHQQMLLPVAAQQALN
jgi:hypothetical protein